jgi:DNA-binding MurR/RpiR family transcriptional regulator
MLQKAKTNGDATVADRIRGASRDMTPSEQKVARVLFSSAMLAGLGTIASLAQRAGVSGPTVIRLTAKLGFASYPAFQAALRNEMEQRGRSALSFYAGGGRVRRGDFLPRSLDVFTASMRRSFERVSPSEFNGMVKAISDIKRPLFLAGGRFTQLLAQFLYLHLWQMRPDVRVIQDGLQPRRDQLLGVGPKSVLLVCDFRRYQADTVALARTAKQRGATVLLLTDPWESPIAEFADHVLLAEVAAPSPYDSMVPAFAVAEALIGAALISLERKALARMRELEDLRTGFEYRGDDRASPRLNKGGPNKRQRKSGANKRSKRHG